MGRAGKLTREQIRAIYRDRTPDKVAAWDHGVSLSAVSRIRRRAAYHDATEGLGPPGWLGANRGGAKCARGRQLVAPPVALLPEPLENDHAPGSRKPGAAPVLRKAR